MKFDDDANLKVPEKKSRDPRSGEVSRNKDGGGFLFIGRLDTGARGAMRRKTTLRRIFAGEPLERRACPAAFTLTPVLDTVTEGNAAEFRVTMDAPSSLPQSVVVSSVAGTATLGVDYMHRTQELLFFPGETEKTFEVQSLIDPADVTEGSETLTVFVTPRGGTPSQLSAVMTINDYVPPDPYSIDFEFDASVPGSVQSLFTAAADLWENVIVGDLPDVTLANGIVVDDLLIQVDMADLGDSVIALAGFTDIRIGNTSAPANGNFSQNGLPYIGQMTINSNFQAAVGIGNTIAHEIGHVIGFGTLWQNDVGNFADLVTGIGTDDPVYVGGNAVREYNQIFSNASPSVPLYEVSTADPPAYDGSYGSHWRDSVFNDYPAYGELMTAAYPVDGDNGVAIPSLLSRVTVGALDDLGYVVSYLGAELYAAPSGTGTTTGGTGGGGVAGGGVAGGVTGGGAGDGMAGSTPPGAGVPEFPSFPGGGLPGSGDLVGGLPPAVIPGADGGGLMGPVLPFGGGQPGADGNQPGSDAGRPAAGRTQPRSLPPRISYADAPPVILTDTAESRERVRRSLEGFYAGGLSPIDIAHLAAEHLARLAAWAEFERAAAWGQRPGLAAGGDGGVGGWQDPDLDDADGVFGDPGLV